MKRLITAIATCMLLLASSEADVIRLRDSVRRTTTERPVLLRDIAILEGPAADRFGDLEIRSAVVGDVMRIRVDEVRELLDEAGAYWGELSLEGGITRVRPPARGAAAPIGPVEAAGRPTSGVAEAESNAAGLRSPFELLDRGGVIAVMAAEVIEAWGQQSDSVRLGVDRSRLAKAVEGLETAEVAVQGNLRGDRFQLRVGGRRSDGRAPRARLIPVDVRVIEMVPVARRPLRSGRRLDASDFTLEPRPIPPSVVALDLESLEDRHLQSDLPAGRSLSATHLRPEIVIERKDDVLVMADDGHVSIHVRGIAIEKGRVGDRIHCRLRTSDPRDRTTWFAVEVVGPGRVRLPRD